MLMGMLNDIVAKDCIGGLTWMSIYDLSIAVQQLLLLGQPVVSREDGLGRPWRAAY